MNPLVLFVGGGRRYELGKLFKQRGYTLMGYESDYDVPLAKLTSFIHKGLSFSDPDCFYDLKEFVLRHKPDIVIPLMDSAIELVSMLGVPVVSSKETAYICFNKRLFGQFLVSKGFEQYYPHPTLFSPVIAKPIQGFGSRGIKYFKSMDEFVETINNADEYLLQRVVEGTEYSVDAYFNKDAKFVDAVVRTRDRVADGEVVVSKTAYYPELIQVVKDIGEAVAIIGPCNMQFIEEKPTSLPYIIEINARLGGGSTFSYTAGLDFISLIENDYLGANNFYEVGNTNVNLKLVRTFRDHYFL